MLEKNTVHRSEITGITAEGSGIARIGGVAVFVPKTAVGDIADIKIVKTKKNYAFGIVENLIKPSLDRCANDCDAYPACGGCVFRHISYDAELRYKQSFVEDALKRIGGVSAPVEKIRSASPLRYRNKSQYPVGATASGQVHSGFYAARSHRIVPVEDCKLAPLAFSEIIRAVEAWAMASGASVYDETTGKGLLRHVFIRKGSEAKEIVVCLVINGEAIPQPELLVKNIIEKQPVKGIVLNINKEQTNVILGKKEKKIYGRSTVKAHMCGLEYEVSARSFYQVNHEMAEQLYNKAAEFVQPEGKVILDLYCGIGSIGLSMAKKAKSLIGVEIISDAVKNALDNARLNGITNAKFLCMDASDAAKYLTEENITPDAVIIDPPRKGCDTETLYSITKDIKPATLVYVSCDPSTLARDIKILTAEGYKLIKAVPFDLFPRTGHVECVVLMSRGKE